MTTRRTVFQPDLEVDLPEDEEKQLEREGLLLPLESEPEKPPVKVGATVTAAASAGAPKEATPDGGK